MTKSENIENIHNFNVKGFQKIVSEALNLGIRKNNAYGKNNIAALGVRGIFVRMWDKINRLKTLIWDKTGKDEVSESVRDTFIDLINYSIYGVMLLDNIWDNNKNIKNMQGDSDES